MAKIQPLTGVGDLDVTISDSFNEGLDTEKRYKVSATNVSKSFVVKQIGLREKFQDSGSNDFFISDGTTFNVIKKEYAVQ